MYQSAKLHTLIDDILTVVTANTKVDNEENWWRLDRPKASRKIVDIVNEFLRNFTPELGKAIPLECLKPHKLYYAIIGGGSGGDYVTVAFTDGNCIVRHRDKFADEYIKSLHDYNQPLPPVPTLFGEVLSLVSSGGHTPRELTEKLVAKFHEYK